MFTVVDKSERGHRSRCHTENLHQEVRLSETKARASNLLMQGLQVDGRVRLCSYEEQTALRVLEEEVLGMATRQLPVETLALRDGEDSFVLRRVSLDAKLGQPFEQVCAGSVRHYGKAWSELETAI